MPMPERISSGNFPMWATLILNEIRKSGQFDNEPKAELDREVFCLMEEAGEVVKAFRQWTGRARRSGTKDKFAEELCDLVMTAFGAAYLAGIDLETELPKKLAVTFDRGWKEPQCPSSTDNTRAHAAVEE